ncbi:MAG: PEP-CTERM sorting domain-containing protein [Cyanobacteria bacterium P01_D01_bin.36]
MNFSQTLLNLKPSITTLLTVATVSMGTALASAAPATAADFVLQDDPLSMIDGSGAMPEVFGNNRNLNNLSLVNMGDRTENLSYVVSNTWTFIDGQLIGLEWDNSRDGWFNEDIDGSNTSLLVSLTNTTDRIRLGDIANLTGESALPLMQPCDTDPSCYIPPFPFPIDTVMHSEDDEVPIFNLGVFAEGESKSFGQDFLFTYGDGREGTTPLLAYGFTASPVAKDIPEPAGVAAFVVVGAALVRRRKQA